MIVGGVSDSTNDVSAGGRASKWGNDVNKEDAGWENSDADEDGAAQDTPKDGDDGGVTLGLSCNRSVGRINGNQATFDNSQRNNLRSCVWVSVVVFSLSPLSFRREEPGYISFCSVVRSDDSG